MSQDPLIINVGPISKKLSVMADIEAFGLNPGSSVVAIGAVRFDLGGIREEFYTAIDLGSCMDIGLTVDADTISWWMRQPKEAIDAIMNNRVGISRALHQFAAFLGTENCTLWGNGSDFDNVLISEAYRAAKIKRPWSYRQNRCFRTTKESHPDIKPQAFEGVKHNALHDARNQALHFIEIAKAKNLKIT